MTHSNGPERPSALSSGRLVVLVSGSGTLLQALIDAAAEDEGLTIAAVVTDRDDAYGLTRAREAGIPTAVVRPRDFPDRATWDEAVARTVRAFDPGLVVLAGFMRLLGTRYLEEFGGRTVNSHPALLPSFPGVHAVRDALAHGVTVTGTTIILIDAGTDTGPILAQEAVPVAAEDTEETLHERIKVVERRLLVDVITRMVNQEWRVEGRHVHWGAA